LKRQARHFEIKTEGPEFEPPSDAKLVIFTTGKDFFCSWLTYDDGNPSVVWSKPAELSRELFGKRLKP